jgi:putative IMPACT (imprinted ancient) family translation regulator
MRGASRAILLTLVSRRRLCGTLGGVGGGGIRATSNATTSGGGSSAVAQGYWTLGAPVLEAELVVKKSRFIASCWPVKTPAEAAALIESATDASASHNCWAFSVAGAARSSDDGEPGGTAGKPILNAIEADGLDGVALLVVRHFGGVKLGAGPLTRAYGEAARMAVRAAPKEFVRAMAALRVCAPATDVGLVYGVLQRLGATATGEPEFETGEGGGELVLAVSVAADGVRALESGLRDATSGRARIQHNTPPP